MSVIHVQQIKSHLTAQFDGLIDMTDYQNKPQPDKDSAFLTRSLAAFCVMHLSNLEPAEAAQSVTDGGQDNGIDAIHYDDNEKMLYVVQSKWKHDGHGSIDRGEAQKFITGFKDLLNARFERFNDKVNLRKAHVEKAINSADSRFSIVVAYTGQEAMGAEPQRDLSDLAREMNDTTDILSVNIIKQADLHSIIASGAKGTPVNFEVALREWGLTREPYQSYYGQVAASEVAAWYSHHPRIFAPNIRMFLGVTEVNQSLMNTLKQEPDRFWYFNNGITALCASIKKKALGGNSREIGYFECAGVSIVNGAQTVGAISFAHANHSESTAKATVLVRFISLENCPEGFATEVTRATNTQNRIERRDFVSLDPEQERLRTELMLETVQYAFKPGERISERSSGFELTEATVALACSNADIGLAVQAKREISKLWEDITRSPYKALFNPSVSGGHLWRQVQVFRDIDLTLHIEGGRRTGKHGLAAIHGNRFVAYEVFKALSKEGLGKPNGNLPAIKARAKELTIQLLQKTFESISRLYPDSYLASLFKNLQKCRRLDGDIAQQPPSQPSPAAPSTATDSGVS